MAKDAAEIVTVQSILSEFSDLEDPRSTVNRVHVLGDIVVISIMAVIDRLVHHRVIIELNVRSYRVETAKRGTSRERSRPTYETD